LLRRSEVRSTAGQFRHRIWVGDYLGPDANGSLEVLERIIVAAVTASCRVCSGSLEEFLDLGSMPRSNRFIPPDEIDSEYFYRLAVGMCPTCTMVQLIEVPSADEVFTADYSYLTSGTAAMRSHLKDVARSLLGELQSRTDPFVVELGSNDGTMLHDIADAGIRHLGVEPAQVHADYATSRGVSTLTEFFTAELASQIRSTSGPADIIFAANTICGIQDIRQVFDGAAALLGHQGMLIIEDAYLGDVIAETAFDQFFDEHVFYFSVQSMSQAADRSGLELIDVEHLPVGGGEMRYRLARRGSYDRKASVDDHLAREELAGLTHPETFIAFAERVRSNARQLTDALSDCRARGQRVVGYGATAKSSTVTNFCHITTELVEFVCDTTPAKQGLLTPGAHLPIRPSGAFADPYPDIALMFAWNHEAEIRAKEKRFADGGGRWLRYVPTVVLD